MTLSDPIAPIGSSLDITAFASLSGTTDVPISNGMLATAEGLGCTGFIHEDDSSQDRGLNVLYMPQGDEPYQPSGHVYDSMIPVPVDETWNILPLTSKSPPTDGSWKRDSEAVAKIHSNQESIAVSGVKAKKLGKRREDAVRSTMRMASPTGLATSGSPNAPSWTKDLFSRSTAFMEANVGRGDTPPGSDGASSEYSTDMSLLAAVSPATLPGLSQTIQATTTTTSHPLPNQLADVSIPGVGLASPLSPIPLTTTNTISSLPTPSMTPTSTPINTPKAAPAALWTAMMFPPEANLSANPVSTVTTPSPSPMTSSVVDWAKSFLASSKGQPNKSRADSLPLSDSRLSSEIASKQAKPSGQSRHVVSPCSSDPGEQSKSRPGKISIDTSPEVLNNNSTSEPQCDSGNAASPAGHPTSGGKWAPTLPDQILQSRTPLSRDEFMKVLNAHVSVAKEDASPSSASATGSTSTPTNVTKRPWDDTTTFATVTEGAPSLLGDLASAMDDEHEARSKRLKLDELTSDSHGGLAGGPPKRSLEERVQDMTDKLVHDTTQLLSEHANTLYAVLKRECESINLVHSETTTVMDLLEKEQLECKDLQEENERMHELEKRLHVLETQMAHRLDQFAGSGEDDSQPNSGLALPSSPEEFSLTPELLSHQIQAVDRRITQLTTVKTQALESQSHETHLIRKLLETILQSVISSASDHPQTFKSLSCTRAALDLTADVPDEPSEDTVTLDNLLDLITAYSVAE
ncbi:hypothetical protein DFS34DRAFT_594601 [Phlyctochytrium arcticum]|nr:hypothetical protein DFS34DRAFT_594601 [Phlyctochytrium arcticum]